MGSKCYWINKQIEPFCCYHSIYSQRIYFRISIIFEKDIFSSPDYLNSLLHWMVIVHCSRYIKWITNSQTSLMRTSIPRITHLREGYEISKSQLLSTIFSMECNSFSENFISVKSSLIRGEILVETPNNSSIAPISPNCRRWRRCEKR